jgi:hypothetical protein
MIETSREGDPDRRKNILWAIEKKLAMTMRGRLLHSCRELLVSQGRRYTIAGVKRFFFRTFSPAVAAIFRRCSPQGRVARGIIAARRLAAIVAAMWLNVSSGSSPDGN